MAKPKIKCLNFKPTDQMALFMKEAFGEILSLTPYESHVEAWVQKELSDYLMTISINFADGKFKTSSRSADLKEAVAKGTADIFAQVRQWWKNRFPKEDKRTDWAGDFKEEGAQSKDDDHDGAKRPLRVLVVDDDIESITPLEICLERLGCETFIVNNGFEAIHEIVSNHRVYDVVILDWNMPEMDGGQALLNAERVISFSPNSINHWEKRTLPFITFSSKSREDIELPPCKDFKHIDHWEKPVSFLQLLNQATQTLSKLEA